MAMVAPRQGCQFLTGGARVMCSPIDVTWLIGEARRVMAIAFGCGVGELENGDVRTTKDG